MTQSIAAASIQMHSSQLSQSVSVALLDKALETTTTSANQLIESLNSLPSYGHKLNVYA